MMALFPFTTMASPTSPSAQLAKSNMDTSIHMHMNEPIDSDLDDEGIDIDARSADSMSISSSVTNYPLENGRRYHAYHAGSYPLPNDEEEQSRLDKVHDLFHVLLNGRLFYAPVQNPQAMLDIGTGTGRWAIDAAVLHPSAQVVGTDLSLIITNWVPPNFQFYVDDVEDEWTWEQDFDLIHGRSLSGAIADWDKLFQQAYDNLKPGGWVEMHELDTTLYSDDGTLAMATHIPIWSDLLNEASERFGKPFSDAAKLKQLMESAGFVDVVEIIHKVPIGLWHRDEYFNLLGRLAWEAVSASLVPYSLALFTRVLNMQPDQIYYLLNQVHSELCDPRFHLHATVRILYGRKPINPSASP